jgi:hypothetical protein
MSSITNWKSRPVTEQNCQNYYAVIVFPNVLSLTKECSLLTTHTYRPRTTRFNSCQPKDFEVLHSIDIIDSLLGDKPTGAWNWYTHVNVVWRCRIGGSLLPRPYTSLRICVRRSDNVLSYGGKSQICTNTALCGLWDNSVALRNAVERDNAVIQTAQPLRERMCYRSVRLNWKGYSGWPSLGRKLPV